MLFYVAKVLSGIQINIAIDGFNRKVLMIL